MPGKTGKTGLAVTSFGVCFGRLVKHKRGVEGLTQQQLAVRAFGKESQKNRISELERGDVDNPHQKTVDLLVIAQRISDDELAACRNPDTAHLPPEIVSRTAEKYRLAQTQLQG